MNLTAMAASRRVLCLDAVLSTPRILAAGRQTRGLRRRMAVNCGDERTTTIAASTALSATPTASVATLPPPVPTNYTAVTATLIPTSSVATVPPAVCATLTATEVASNNSCYNIDTNSVKCFTDPKKLGITSNKKYNACNVKSISEKRFTESFKNKLRLTADYIAASSPICNVVQEYNDRFESMKVGVDSRYLSNLNARRKTSLLIATSWFNSNCSRTVVNSRLFSEPPKRYLNTVSRNRWDSKLNDKPGNGMLQQQSAHSDEDLVLTGEEALAFVKTEHHLFKHENYTRIPHHLTKENCSELAQISNLQDRLNFLRYLHSIGNRKRYSKNKKEKLEQLQSYFDAGEPNFRNFILSNWPLNYMDNIDNHRLMNALMYGQAIIFDNSFGSNLTTRQRRRLAQEFGASFGCNRSHVDPFSIHLCCFDPQEETAKCFLEHLPKLLEEGFPVEVHKESSVELFGREKLVYITRDGENEMMEFDHDAVYVIGNCLVNPKSHCLSAAQAKREGIKTLKLPYDRFVKDPSRSKILRSNHIIGILLEFRRTGSWVKAFDEHVPMKPPPINTNRHKDFYTSRTPPRERHNGLYTEE